MNFLENARFSRPSGAKLEQIGATFFGSSRRNVGLPPVLGDAADLNRGDGVRTGEIFALPNTTP